MHPNVREALACLDASRAALEAAVASVPEPLHRTRPGPARWSVIDVVEHLAKVDRFFAERIAAAIADAQRGGLPPEEDPRAPLPADVARAIGDRTDRRPAREAMMPSGSVDLRTAWDALDRARAEVRAVMAAADGLALGRVTADHRLFGRLTVYQWVELTAAHETRHADQIREIGATLGGRTGHSV